MSTRKFSIEYDGALVLDGVVVVSPGPGLPKEAIKELVNAVNAQPDLLAALTKAIAALNHTPRFYVPSLQTTSYVIVAQCEHAYHSAQKP